MDLDRGPRGCQKLVSFHKVGETGAFLVLLAAEFLMPPAENEVENTVLPVELELEYVDSEGGARFQPFSVDSHQWKGSFGDVYGKDIQNACFRNMRARAGTAPPDRRRFRIQLHYIKQTFYLSRFDPTAESTSHYSQLFRTPAAQVAIVGENRPLPDGFVARAAKKSRRAWQTWQEWQRSTGVSIEQRTDGTCQMWSWQRAEQAGNNNVPHIVDEHVWFAGEEERDAAMDLVR